MSFTAIIKINAVVLCAVNVVLAFAGTILNSVVILSLLTSQLRKKLCYFTILILACFDLAVVIIHPFTVLEIVFKWASTNVFESIWNDYAVYHLYVFSSNALLTMIVERYIALMYPFFHKKIVTKSRLMTAFWIFQTPFGLLYIFEIMKLNDLDWVHTFGQGLFVMFFLITCTLNFKLFHFARTLKKRAAVTLGSFEASDCGVRTLETKKMKVSLASSRKISTCFLAVICLLVCHVPFIVSFAVRLTDGLDQNKRFIIMIWSKTFVTLNSSLNCLIFFYKNSVLQRLGEKFLKKCFCGRMGLHDKVSPL